MKISTFGYTIKQGIKNIWTNKMFSIASIATMAACIFMFGMFYSIVINFQHVVKDVESGVAITVFFDDGTTQDQIDAIGQEIAMRPEVSSFNYVSAEEAWEEYKLEYFDGDEAAAASFGTDNPLAGESNYEIYMEDISQQSSLVSYLEGLDHVSRVRQSEMVANTLTDFNRLVSIVSAVIILILICVAVFLISNTVRTGIAVRKEEIGIMKVIGATDYFVRAPFIVEGILIGLIGAAIPLIILHAMYGRIIEYVANRFGFLNNLLTFLPVDTVFQILLPVGLILGVGIGYIGSRVTVRKHINV
ncbi:MULTISPECIES: permease-like cell division protein FtsX [Clostridia]|jgi:cell division transport system permease protein|uniref:permease-like cell division protein FtsX n=1 Tax=Clostridia TaxID=186801 RepID=UPI000E46B63B|nr:MULTISPECIES: permease-like cell division protein FtsX [Clostridia]RHV67406.1 ABC transporter permease [Roseburia sp. OM02-15]